MGQILYKSLFIRTPVKHEQIWFAFQPELMSCCVLLLKMNQCLLKNLIWESRALILILLTLNKAGDTYRESWSAEHFLLLCTLCSVTVHCSHSIQGFNKVSNPADWIGYCTTWFSVPQPFGVQHCILWVALTKDFITATVPARTTCSSWGGGSQF